MLHLALVSGGLDSAVLLAYLARRMQEELIEGSLAAFWVDYGQLSAQRERSVVLDLCDLYGAFFHEMSLPKGWTSSEITDYRGVDNKFPGAYVPNRNMVLVSLAAAYGMRLTRGGLLTLYTGIHQSPTFPDCQPGFLALLEKTVAGGTGRSVELLNPFSQLTKTEVVEKGYRLGVPMEKTWSCYYAGPEPCGECWGCTSRKEALEDAGSND